jgi:tetratricopeptide (TPR) repeat protein
MSNSTTNDPATVLTLSFLDPRTGRVRRTRRFPSVGWQFPDHANLWGVHAVLATDIDRDGANEVAVTYSHMYWPSFTMLHDLRSDESRILFLAAGHHHVVGMHDLDGDGRDELLLAGISNRLGWNIGVAAVRVPSDVPPGDIVAATPERELRVASNGLLWYALLPPGPVGPVKPLQIDETTRRITVAYERGEPHVLDFDGFSTPSALPAAERQAARNRAYELLRAALRSSAGGSFERAVNTAADARRAAATAGDARLLEWIERVHARLLVQAGRVAEAQAAFTAITGRSDAKADVAWDAAQSMHLAGELPRAVEWYRTGMRHRVEAPFAGRLLYEYAEALILALGEMGRWSEALEAAEAFPRTDPDSPSLGHWFRRYVAWRSGGVLEPVSYQAHEIDIARYWALEMSLANGGDPRKVLPLIEAEETRSSGNRDLLLATRSEALRRLGRNDDALALAREAYRQVRLASRTSTESRAHFDLVARRLIALAPKAEAATVAREAGLAGVQLE